MIAVIPVAALNEVNVIEGFPLPPPKLAKKRPPDLPYVLEFLRQILRIKGKGIASTLESEQNQPQFQPVHTGSADGGVPGRTERI